MLDGKRYNKANWENLSYNYLELFKCKADCYGFQHVGNIFLGRSLYHSLVASTSTA